MRKAILLLAVLIFAVAMLEVRMTRYWSTQTEINRARYNDVSNLCERVKELKADNKWEEEKILHLFQLRNAEGTNWQFLADSISDLYRAALKSASNQAVLIDNQKWLATNQAEGQTIIVLSMNAMITNAPTMTNLTLHMLTLTNGFRAMPMDTNLLQQLLREHEERDRRDRMERGKAFIKSA